MSRKGVIDAYDRLCNAVAALPHAGPVPETPDEAPLEFFLQMGAVNCAMWGSTVNDLIEQGEKSDPMMVATAVTILRLASECYLAAFHELKGTFAKAAMQSTLS